MTLPNWLGIGAGRCGTTTLQGTLLKHPDVYCAPAKECNFFNRETITDTDLAEYEFRHFWEHKQQTAVGEITPAYLMHPRAPGHIRDVLGPDTKIVMTFRNPADRAFSHYLQHTQGFVEFRSFEKAIEDEHLRPAPGDQNYLHASYYYESAKRYYDLFPRENIFVAIYETDIAGDFPAAMNRLFAFLEVPEFEVKPLQSNESKIPEIKFENNTIVFENARPYRTGRYRVRHPSANLRSQFVSLARNNTPEPPAAFRKMMLDRLFRDDIRKLQDLIGIDLSLWV